MRRIDNSIAASAEEWGISARTAWIFAWLPIIGDALAAGAGWLRVNGIAVTLCMAAGRLSRYIVVAALA